MKELKVGQWNALGATCSPETNIDALEEIRRADADLFLVNEALDLAIDHSPVDANKRKIETFTELCEKLEADGYEPVIFPYDDTYAERDGRPLYYMTLFSRLEGEHYVDRVGIRNNLRSSVKIGSDEFSFGSIHLDDRSEASRIEMTKDLLGQDNLSGETPAIIAGDFNALGGDLLTSRILRSRLVTGSIEYLPKQRLRSLASRLSEFAIGSTMEMLEEAGYEDADSKGRSTKLTSTGGWPVVQIDRIMHTEHFGVDRFGVMEGTRELSDHLGIVATLAV